MVMHKSINMIDLCIFHLRLNDSIYGINFTALSFLNRSKNDSSVS